MQRLFGTPNPTPYVKDGINDYVVAGRQDAVNPNHTGTKAAAHYQLSVGAAGDCGHPAAADRMPRATSVGHSARVRRNHRGTSARGRRVLSGDNARRCRRRCGQRDEAGAGRNAVEQAVLLLRRRHVAAGAWRRSAAPVIPAMREPASGST